MRTILPKDTNPALREIAREIPLSQITSEPMQSLIEEMRVLLSKEEHGVALAAPQVGESLRLFIIAGEAIARDRRTAPDEPESEELPPSDADDTVADQVYINPVMVKMSRGKKGKHEGCLSIRGKWGIVPRAEKAMVRAYDQDGKEFTRGASGFIAHVFQHEMDHLDGILYIDKATSVYDDKPKEQ